MRALPLIAAAMIILPVISPASARDRKAEAASLTPIPGAKPQNCVQIIGIRESRVRDDSTIDFYMRDGKIYRNALPNSCPSLGFERAFSYATSLSELCSVDIITVIRQGGAGAGGLTGASCGLGMFRPVQAASGTRRR